MGKSGGGGGGGGTQVVQPARPSIPNEEMLQSSGLWRLHASSPWYSSPWRTMDFAQNWFAPTVQMPTFTNPMMSQPWGTGGGMNPTGFTGGFVPSGGQQSFGKGMPNSQPSGGQPQQSFGKGNPGGGQGAQPAVMPLDGPGGAGPRKDQMVKAEAVA